MSSRPSNNNHGGQQRRLGHRLWSNPLKKTSNNSGTQLLSRKPLQSLSANHHRADTSKQEAAKEEHGKPTMAASMTANTSLFSMMKLKNKNTSKSNATSIILDKCLSSCTDQQEQLPEEEEPKIVFRSTVWLDGASSDEEEDEEHDGLWTLKRASPVCDSDDEFQQYESPAKRTKTLNLDWACRLSDEVPILLNLEDEASR